MPDIVGGNQIALGTKQYLLVEVTDIAGVESDLSGNSPKYTVKDEPFTTTFYNDTTATATGMTVYCLIDTTVGAWVVGHYLLWVKFTLAPEVPLLGPFDFYLI